MDEVEKDQQQGYHISDFTLLGLRLQQFTWKIVTTEEEKHNTGRLGRVPPSK
jgi:hypothetical protein